MRVCLEHAEHGDAGAIGALCALYLGLRASEITDRLVRDVDDEGRLLWVPTGKTRKAKRTLEVPEPLRPLLCALTEGRPASAELFPGDRHWLLKQVKKMCRLAKVPVVCSHGMRGLHSTLAMEMGATGHAVAQALGHESFATTKRHYLGDGALSRGSQRRALSLIAGGKQ